VNTTICTHTPKQKVMSDPFDAVLNLEEQHIEEGYEAGKK
jgi:hypothetical protein